MTDQKISQLAPVSSLTGTEAVPVVQNGASRRTTVADIAALGGGGGGGGSVTSVSVNPSDGIVATVDTAVSTPAINLALGAITPDSVASVGTVTGSNLSGTNTGDQAVFRASGPSHSAGIVPDPGASAGSLKFLREDATWSQPPGAKTRLPSLTMATMGDSYAAIGLVNTASSKSYGGESIPAWLRNYLGGRVHMPLAFNFAVGATDIATAIASLPAVLAARPDVVFLSTGRNNLQNGAYTWLQCVNLVMPGIVKPLLDAGVEVLWLPVIQHSFNFNTAAHRQNRDAYNRFIYDLCSGQLPAVAAAFNLPEGRLPMAVDMRFAWDNTTGYALPNYILNDNTHLTARACHETVFRPNGLGPAFDRLLPPRVQNALTFDDIYHATNFPAGNLITNGTANHGLLAGTTGSKLANAGVTPTGDVATGWQALRQLGDSTGSTMACSKSSPRGDGYSGTGQVAAIAVGTPGAVFSELYRFGYNGSGNAVNSGFAAGDKVRMHAAYELRADPLGFLGAACAFSESGNATNQTYYDGQAGTGALARGPNGKYRGLLMTDVMTVQAATTQLNPYLYMYLRGDMASTLDIEWVDVAVRKVPY